MIELTIQQRQNMASETPPRALDPDTRTTYVLIREDLYNRVKTLFAGNDDAEFARESYAQAMEVFGRDGWNDPAMDVYDDLDPRRKS